METLRNPPQGIDSEPLKEMKGNSMKGNSIYSDPRLQGFFFLKKVQVEQISSWVTQSLD